MTNPNQCSPEPKPLEKMTKAELIGVVRARDEELSRQDRDKQELRRIIHDERCRYAQAQAQLQIHDRHLRVAEKRAGTDCPF